MLERQIREAIADGERMLTDPFDDGKWTQWALGAQSLIGRACGPDWADRFESETGSPGFDIVGEYPHRPSDEELLEDRNADVTAKLAIARAAVHDIEQELERRDAQPSETSLPARDFAVIRSDPLRAIAVRYGELRGPAGGTVKAAALLAGSVVEAVLHDALERQGFGAKQLDEMRFAELIDKAAAADLIKERTKNAAHAVRDVRNLVHPGVELRDGERLRKVDADAAIALMSIVLEDLA